MNAYLLILTYLTLSLSQPIEIIAHRGSPEKSPENTMNSFEQAVADGATIIEVDVHQSVDGIPVIIHDYSIDRTTDGRGKINELTFEKIRSHSAGLWFDRSFEKEKVPSLDEVLNWLPKGIKLLIEIKDDSSVYPDIGINVWSLIRKHKKEESVIIKSFNTDILDDFAEIAPDISRLKIIVFEINALGIGLNIERGFSTGSVYELDVDYIQMHNFGISKSKVDKAHKAGKKIFVWSVDDEDDMKKLIDMGVDGIETDNPDKLRALIDNLEFIKN